jgi:hypothetical protein
MFFDGRQLETALRQFGRFRYISPSIMGRKVRANRSWLVGTLASSATAILTSLAYYNALAVCRIRAG